MTFLAVSHDMPEPSAEVAGILFLDVPAVYRLTRGSATLGDFLASGGRALLRAPLNPSLPLVPFEQLQLLPRLFTLHPNLTKLA